MKRLLLAAGAALLSVAVVPALAQERPNPGAGSQGTAVERPAPSSPAPSAPSAPPPSSVGSSSGGSSPSPSGWSGGERAVPRGEGHNNAGRSRRSGPSTGGTSQGGRTGATAGTGNSNDPGGAGYGGYARPRGPHPAQGTAVARRGGDVTPLPPYWHGDYWDYYYWFPYYGPWGLYFYWDPYMWGDYYPGPYGDQPYGGYNAYNGENGSLKLKVKPRTAQVYLDGYLVGIVDDFDGVFQSLKTRAGGHRLEIRQEGFKALTVEVMVQPDATTTFRGTLEPLKK